MNSVKIRDDAIWISHLEGDHRLKERILSLRAGEIIRLEVAGVEGVWEKMRDGKDGRPTHGIKPISEMRSVWAKLRAQTGSVVAIREIPNDDSYLAAVASTLSEWNSPEDEAAYAHL